MYFYSNSQPARGFGYTDVNLISAFTASFIAWITNLAVTSTVCFV